MTGRKVVAGLIICGIILTISNCSHLNKKHRQRPRIDWYNSDFKAVGIIKKNDLFPNKQKDIVQCDQPEFNQFTCISASDLRRLMEYIHELEYSKVRSY